MSIFGGKCETAARKAIPMANAAQTKRTGICWSVQSSKKFRVTKKKTSATTRTANRMKSPGFMFALQGPPASLPAPERASRVEQPSPCESSAEARPDALQDRQVPQPAISGREHAKREKPERARTEGATKDQDVKCAAAGKSQC